MNSDQAPQAKLPRLKKSRTYSAGMTPEEKLKRDIEAARFVVERQPVAARTGHNNGNQARVEVVAHKFKISISEYYARVHPLVVKARAELAGRNRRAGGAESTDSDVR